MHTQETEREPSGANDREAQGLGVAAKQLAERASSLAGLELKRKAGLLTTGIGLAVGAAVLVFYGIGFGLAAIAAGVATATSVWLALLIVTLGLVLVAGVLAVFAVRAIKKATPPVPEQAIAEAKLTTEVLKHNGHG